MAPRITRPPSNASLREGEDWVLEVGVQGANSVLLSRDFMPVSSPPLSCMNDIMISFVFLRKASTEGFSHFQRAATTPGLLLSRTWHPSKPVSTSSLLGTPRPRRSTPCSCKSPPGPALTPSPSAVSRMDWELHSCLTLDPCLCAMGTT